MKTDDGAMAAAGREERSGVQPRSAARARGTPQADAGGVSISADERRHLIAEAAYFRAESRGFEPGRELDDWLRAETEIDAALLRS